MDDSEQLAVVWSSEKTVAKLADFTDEQKADGVHNFGAVDGMRIRVLPVLGTMPAVMGQTLAAMALCKLGGKPFTPVTGERVGRGVRHKLHQRVKRREKIIRDKVEGNNNKDVVEGESNTNGDGTKTQPESKPAGDDEIDRGHVVNGTWVGPIQIDGDDVEYLMEVWRNRCGVSGDRLGTVLDFVRWDMSKPSTCNNMVLIGASAKQKFDAEGKAGIPLEIQQQIEERLATCRIDAKSY